MGHTGLPVTRSNTYKNPVLSDAMTALIRFPSTVINFDRVLENFYP
jgi:hypothetical protein